MAFVGLEPGINSAPSTLCTNGVIEDENIAYGSSDLPLGRKKPDEMPTTVNPPSESLRKIGEPDMPGMASHV